MREANKKSKGLNLEPLVVILIGSLDHGLTQDLIVRIQANIQESLSKSTKRTSKS